MNAREDWLAARRLGLGGSDIGAILGLSKYRTPVDVWMEKTGRTLGSEETLQMRFGSYAEEFVAREYSAQTGRAVQRYNTMLHHAAAPVLGNVDRLVIPEGAKRASHQREIRTDIGLECKTASAFAAYDADEWGPAGTDQVPPSYLVQCGTYMALTGCPRWDLAVLFGNQEVRVYRLARDADLERELIARAGEWWQRHVVADVAPEPICDDDVRTLFPRDDGSAVEASASVLTELARAQELRAQIKALEAELEGDRKAGTLGALGSIKAFMGEAARLTHGGADLVTWKSAKDTAVTDWKTAFMEAAEDLTDAERDLLIGANTTTKAGSRRLLIKE